MDNNLNIKTVHVCRTCMREIISTSFFHLDFTQVDNEPTIGQKLSNCIPELDLSIVLNTVICGKCADTINSLYIFKKECLQLEMQICEYIQQVQHTGNAIDLKAVMQFRQLHPKNHTAELKMEAFETERYTEVANREYLTSLQMVERQCVLFNTFENFINSDQSEAEKNSDTHNDSNIVQDCLLQVIENPDSCVQNLNKSDIYYQCFTCGHKAESKLKLIRHLKSHTYKKLYRKTISVYSCNRKEHLKRQMLTYLGEKPFKCSICEHSFNRKDTLKKHLLTHTGEKPFKYSICEHSFNRKDTLRMHLLTHTGEKPFKCSICEHSFNRKDTLRMHLLTHTGEKPFKCSICEHSFNKKSTLKMHLLTHTDEKPFKCSICEYSFNKKSTLKMHLLTHTGEKPFKCSVCEYSCNRKASLKSHMLTHTGEKPFKCSVCDYSCTRKQHLKRHMINHTSKKTFKCSICEHRSATRYQLKIHMQNHL